MLHRSASVGRGNTHGRVPYQSGVHRNLVAPPCIETAHLTHHLPFCTTPSIRLDMADHIGLYARYKTHTSRFLGWLVPQGVASGYLLQSTAADSNEREKLSSTSPAGSGRRKRRKATKPKKYIVSVRQITELAGHLASLSTVPYMPKSIQNAVCRAIKLRQRSATLFDGIAEDDGANATHRYFIKTLEDALRVLADAGCTQRARAKTDTKKQGEPSGPLLTSTLR